MNLVGILLSRWFLSFVGTALLAVLVWFFGPLLSPLESWLVRLAIILFMLVVWAGVNLLLDLRKRRRDAALTAGLAGRPDTRNRSDDPAARTYRGRAAGMPDPPSQHKNRRGSFYQPP